MGRVGDGEFELFEHFSLPLSHSPPLPLFSPRSARGTLGVTRNAYG
jgi:hypothetical protein